MYYLRVEREAHANEAMISAVGVANAIAQCFGDKTALRRFRRQLEPRGSRSASTSSDMSELKRRLRMMGVFEKER